MPTVTWTDACDEVAAQLAAGDELLVVHDDANDPVVDRAGTHPDGARLVAAGDPNGCSGKANAISSGMEAAEHDRIVWTDDDFHHSSDWLDQLAADYEAHGPVTELPVFVGRDPLSILLEPVYIAGGTLGTYAGNYPWAGAVIFECADIDEDAFLNQLQQTVSDDSLLGEHLDVTALRRTREVPIGGSLRETLERHVRFGQIVFRHDPVGISMSFILLLVIVTASVLYPIVGGVVTLLTIGTYGAFGHWRATALLAVLSFAVGVPLAVYAVARRTFVWGGRRYRWRSKFDVEVVGDA